MEIDVYQTVKEEDGTISAYVHFKDSETGKILKSRCIQGTTQKDFETKIDETINQIESDDLEKGNDLILVQNAVTKIKERKK